MFMLSGGLNFPLIQINQGEENRVRFSPRMAHHRKNGYLCGIRFFLSYGASRSNRTTRRMSRSSHSRPLGANIASEPTSCSSHSMRTVYRFLLSERASTPTKHPRLGVSHVGDRLSHGCFISFSVYLPSSFSSVGVSVSVKTR